MGLPMIEPRRTPAWRRYLRFWGSDPRRDLDDELRFHLAARYDEYVAAGMSPNEARAAVERRFGDVENVRRSCADIDSQFARERSMLDLWHGAVADLRYALRQLRRNTALSLAAIICLALASPCARSGSPAARRSMSASAAITRGRSFLSSSR